jgi:hypothetical protein
MWGAPGLRVAVLVFALLFALPAISPVRSTGGPIRSAASDFGVTLHGPSTLLLGQNATYWANLTGGTLPYTVHWGLNGSEVVTNLSSNATSGRFDFRPMGDGLYVITVNATDHGGNRSADIRDVSVGGGSPFTVALQAAENSSAGHGVTLIATVSGGIGPLRFRWTAPGVSTNWTNSSEATTRPLPSGDYHVLVEVRDVHGYSVTGGLTVRVNVDQASTGTDWPVWAGIGIVVGLAGVLGATYILRRRRASKDP